MFKKNIMVLAALLVFSYIQTKQEKPKESNKNHVTKSVILAGGLGTRFLPLTKSIPKEMLPILNKPTMQYIVEESLGAGITNFLMVTSSSKYAIENYFDFDNGLESFLTQKNKKKAIESIDAILERSHFTYLRQPKPLGVGHAVLMAKHCIGKEYFAVILPDDLFFGKKNLLEKMIEISQKEDASVIAVQEVPIEKVSSYGIVKIKKQLSSDIFEISELIEKPAIEDAPSNMAIVGRYILSHKIFNSIESIEPGRGGELQLTDAIMHMIQKKERVLVYKINGDRYDTGNPLGWVKAVIGVSLKDPLYGPQVKEFIKEMAN